MKSIYSKVEQYAHYTNDINHDIFTDEEIEQSINYLYNLILNGTEEEKERFIDENALDEEIEEDNEIIELLKGGLEI